MWRGRGGGALQSEPNCTMEGLNSAMSQECQQQISSCAKSDAEEIETDLLEAHGRVWSSKARSHEYAAPTPPQHGRACHRRPSSPARKPSGPPRRPRPAAFADSLSSPCCCCCCSSLCCSSACFGCEGCLPACRLPMPLVLEDSEAAGAGREDAARSSCSCQARGACALLGFMLIAAKKMCPRLAAIKI